MQGEADRAKKAVISKIDVVTLSEGELSEIETLIEKGSAVDVASAMFELPLAPHVALARSGSSIIGIAAIKRPRPGYARDAMENAGYEFDGNMHELGYVVVASSHRGNRHSSTLTDTLLGAFDGPLWSTTDDEVMQGTLKRRGFVQHGKSWKGKRGQLTLWLRPGPDQRK